MPYISLVINCDTRTENNTFGGENLTGVVNQDFLTDSILQKQKFLEGYNFETIVFIDKHNEIPETTLKYLDKIADIVCIRKHTDELRFNDWNYYRALSLCTGKIIIPADQDSNMYRGDKSYVDELISHLDNYKFVSYPSHWTPAPVHDETFKSQWWCSTRFFMCYRESLKLDLLYNCIENPGWLHDKYGESARRCDWTEHFLTKINDYSVYYPPVELHKGAIFSWATYDKYTIQRLNEMPYEYVKQWILHRGGIQYPVDVKCE